MGRGGIRSFCIESGIDMWSADCGGSNMSGMDSGIDMITRGSLPVLSIQEGVWWND